MLNKTAARFWWWVSSCKECKTNGDIFGFNLEENKGKHKKWDGQVYRTQSADATLCGANQISTGRWTLYLLTCIPRTRKSICQSKRSCGESAPISLIPRWSFGLTIQCHRQQETCQICPTLVPLCLKKSWRRVVFQCVHDFRNRRRNCGVGQPATDQPKSVPPVPVVIWSCGGLG